MTKKKNKQKNKANGQQSTPDSPSTIEHSTMETQDENQPQVEQVETSDQQVESSDPQVEDEQLQLMQQMLQKLAEYEKIIVTCEETIAKSQTETTSLQLQIQTNQILIDSQSLSLQTKDKEIAHLKAELEEKSQVIASQPEVVAAQPESPKECEDCVLLTHYCKRYGTWQSVISDIDTSSEDKSSLIQLLIKKQIITTSEHPLVLYQCAYHNEWELANTLLSITSKQNLWIALRKCISNWESLPDKRRCKEFCIAIMKQNDKAMTSLNQWAQKQSKQNKQIKRAIRGYCDLCTPGSEAHTFAMQYSEL
jgi:hypothetical protein